MAKGTAIEILDTLLSYKRGNVICLIALVMTFICMHYALPRAGGTPETMTVHDPETVRLPQPRTDSDFSVEETLLKRRSVRSFKDGPLTLSEISQLLWAAQGITSSNGLRTAPSAGALYPLEVYIIAGNVKDLPDGIYNYMPYEHGLVKVAEGDRRDELCTAALGQTSVRNAPAIIVFSAVYERITVKYGERGIQYTHMEAGHAAQNVLLQSVSLGLGTVVIGAFHDEAVKKVLKLSGRERPLYMMPVGRMK